MSTNNNGNQLTVTDSNGTIERTYDELNRVLTKTVSNIGTVNYTYDIITPGVVEDGFVAEKTVDPKNNITVKIFDKTGRLKYVKDGDLDSTNVTTYNYYNNGSRQSVIYPNGAKEEYTYYKNNLLWTLENYKKVNSTYVLMDSYAYTYDNAHNQTSKSETINCAVKGTTSYTYDDLNRLETVTEPNGRFTKYTYDKAGNRRTESVTHNGVVTIDAYYYDKQNRLTKLIKIIDDSKVEEVIYGYDHNGNLNYRSVNSIKTVDTSGVESIGMRVHSYVSNSGVTINTYDGFNQLIKTSRGNKIITYAYNGEGYRIEKTVGDSVTRYLYEYDKVVLEVDGSGNQIARNIYGTNLLMRTVDGQTLYYMYNGHADVTALIDAAGNIAASYYYDSFGNILESTGDVNNPIRYAGYQYDEETGLYYLNARMYDPKVARFLQEDTYTGDPNDPLSLNLYTYCLNNPIIYWDPTGHVAANVQIGEYTFETGDVTDGTTTVTEEEFLNRTGYGKYFINQGFGFKLDESMMIIGEDGQRRVKLRAFSESLDIQDTISWWHDDGGKLNVLIQPEMKYNNIKVTREENNVNIKAYVEFSGAYKDVFPGTSLTYADVAMGGIISTWSNLSFAGTSYDFGVGRKISVQTQVFVNSNTSTKVAAISGNVYKGSNKQKFLKINIDNITTGKNSYYGDGGGYYNDWSITNIGGITLYTNKNESQKAYGKTAAHEFGHALGLGDAYGYKPIGRPSAPINSEVKKDEIMWFNGSVNANDIEMVLEAWKTNEWQYFTDWPGYGTKSKVIRL